MPISSELFLQSSATLHVSFADFPPRLRFARLGYLQGLLICSEAYRELSTSVYFLVP